MAQDKPKHDTPPDTDAAKAATGGGHDGDNQDNGGDKNDSGTDKDGDEKQPNFGERLNRAWVLGLRSVAVPVARSYAPIDNDRDEDEQTDEKLNQRELEALKRAGRKLLIEAGELGVRAYPPLDDGQEIPRATRDPATDRYGEPTLAYLVSAVQALGTLRARSSAQASPAGDAAVPDKIAATPKAAARARRPAPMSSPPAAATSAANFRAPPTPGIARASHAVPRSARVRRGAPIREVNMTRTLRFATTHAVGPAAGMNARSAPATSPRMTSSPRVVTAAPMRPRLSPAAMPPHTGSYAIATTGYAPEYAAPAGYAASGCCACGTASLPPAVPRYDEDGNCDVGIFDIDCETRARLAQCFKKIICDLLLCIGDELCEDGKLKLDDRSGGNQGEEEQEEGDSLGERLLSCLGTAVCSAVECIPQALCPPPPVQQGPCAPLPCSFAVEEVPHE